MATQFLEPGGDADFAVATTNGFWSFVNAGVAIVTDFIHGNHVKSIRYPPAAIQRAISPIASLNDAGSRVSVYIYIVALPTATASLFELTTSAALRTAAVRITSGGVLQLWAGAQIGTNGATLSTGVWYRLSLAYTIASASVNEFRLFKDGVSTISVTNGTLTNISSNKLSMGNVSNDTTLDFRSSDHYIDDSSALTDPGDIMVTAKRPISNGSVNNFTTQIGSGGSGVGTGHSPQVNERALSKTNGWSMIGAGSAVTEEYTVEAANVGDIDITGKTIVDWLGWISADATVGETASIIAGGVSSSYTTPAAANTRLVTKIVGSTAYPAGGTDVGIISDTALTTLNLYECGVLIAYLNSTPTPVASKSKPTLLTLGVG